MIRSAYEHRVNAGHVCGEACTGKLLTNPLTQAIDRLLQTSTPEPTCYQTQERIANMLRDTDATSMPYALRREVADTLQDEAWIEDNVTHMQLCSAEPSTPVFERLQAVLRLQSWRRIRP